MKLRNKKTGKIIDSVNAQLMIITPSEIPIAYLSINELIENWEDVDSNNGTNIPLIKDEKIRKILKAWSEVSGVDTSEIKVSKGKKYISFVGWIEDEYEGVSIDFETCNLDEFQSDKVYTIEELCGEEEE